MRQTLLTIVLVVLIIATVYVWFTFVRQPAGTDLGVTPSPAISGEDERLAQYRELKNLAPDTSILQDPLFKSLSRYRPSNQPVSGQPGRANPFAPF